MTSPCTTTAAKHNFNCVLKASLELINLPLIDILANHVKEVDLFNKINCCSTLVSGRYRLRTDQLKICHVQPPAIPDYSQFDVTLLYTLIRNLCPSLKPTQGWGKEPKNTDTQLGDDIERLRLFRNNWCAHVVSKGISNAEFKILWKNLKSVINRIQSNGQTVCSVNYEEELIAIENFRFTQGHLENCKLLLQALVNLQTDEREEPEVVIEGKDEVICGELTQLEAVLKPDSSCWSIKWQKRRGKNIQMIDKSEKKYSGSTNRKLVIQSVCKEDEGEYLVLVSHESNGKGYLICGSTFCLRVFGDLPHLNDLEVTTEDEGIIIHYKYEVSGESPKVHCIEWSKDGQVLDMNTWKFVGGRTSDSRLTISLPTEDDKGKYSCKITNSVGSVSKDVSIDVPSIDIGVNSTVNFSSKATITAVVSSTPPPEKVKWQKSKDGKDFHCIDITKPNYYGSKELPFKPLLMIPKTTFDDGQYYRLLVRNKIGESVSDTVYLNVTGSPPNITTSQETNIKNRHLRLIATVSLYDDSPIIQEVFWTKNGKKIDIQGSGGRLSGVTIDDPSLTIRDVNSDDAGEYQFTAVNAVGSTTSDVIVLGVPRAVFEKNENIKDGRKSYLVTIQSVPSPFSVTWSSKGVDEDIYKPIDVNDKDYKGTINTLPHPMLVLKESKHENNNYQIEIANFIGCTVKEILDNQICPMENTTKESKLHTVRDAGIKFAKLSNYLAKKFPHQELENLKYIIRASGKVENVSSIMSARSAMKCFTILQDENLFTQKDVIFMQFLCKEMECDELYSRCIEYAVTNKALCYFEKPTEYGYKNVEFHIKGELDDYTKEHQKIIVEVVADILGCETQEIFVNGVKPSNSFILVLSIKEVYAWKLRKMNHRDCIRLMELNIDYFNVDLNIFFLHNLEGGSHFGNPEKEMSNWIKFQKASPFCSILSTQNRETDKEIERKNERKNIQDRYSPLKNRAYCQLNTDIDESQDLSLTSSDVGHLNIESFSRSRSTTTLAGSTFVSADTETCYNRDEKTTTIIHVEKPYIHETFAKVSEQFGIERDSSFGASNSSEITLPSAGHYGMSNDKGGHSLCRYQTHVSNLSGLPISKSLINPNNKAQKEKEQEPGFASKLGEQLSLTFERFEIQEVKKVESQPVWHRDSLKPGCTSRNCVYSQKCDNQLLTHSKKKLNSRDINQMHLTLSSKQSSCDSLKAFCKKGFRILDNSDGRETKKRKCEEGFEPDKKN